LFYTPFNFGSGQQDASPACFTTQSNVGPQAHNLPIIASARVRFAQAQAVSDLKMHWWSHTTSSPPILAIQSMINDILLDSFGELVFDGSSFSYPLSQIRRRNVQLWYWYDA
jgi:hypothetical protein